MMVGDPRIPVDKVRKHVQEFLKVLPKTPEIKLAELKDSGGLYGSLVLIKQK